MQRVQQNHNLKPILKESATDSLYQSTFLPIFQDAETKIKLLILGAFLILSSKRMLLAAIAGVIASVDKKIPEGLRDRKAYMDGLRRRSAFYVNQYYSLPKLKFEKVKSRLEATAPKGVTLPKIENPQQLMDFTKDKKNLWAEAKASPYVRNYPTEVQRKMDEFASIPMTTYEDGKKPISLWQKAELDVRYNKQMENLEELKNEGVQYAYLSSHPDCSKRCQAWQGSLVALNKRAESPQKTVDKKFNYRKLSFLIGKIDGKNVYSLPDIMDVVGPYGYNNNIYCGFNCRHRLIPYEPGKAAPNKYEEKDIKKQRAIEENIRRMEREIRYQKTRLAFYEKMKDEKIVQKLKKEIRIMVERYKAYCERNGYAWYEYRINIKEGSN